MTATLDTHRRIATTLRGAAASARGALLRGALTEEVAPGGFELFEGATRVAGLGLLPSREGALHDGDELVDTDAAPDAMEVIAATGEGRGPPQAAGDPQA